MAVASRSAPADAIMLWRRMQMSGDVGCNGQVGTEVEGAARDTQYTFAARSNTGLHKIFDVVGKERLKYGCGNIGCGSRRARKGRIRSWRRRERKNNATNEPTFILRTWGFAVL